MKTEHTKGPWITEGWENLVVNSADGYAICGELTVREIRTMTLAAGGKDACLDELKANACLIAAAPELLAALYELVKYDEGTSEEGTYGSEVMERCRAAISKAEGNA
tara:strand:- start:958 stop:1278 length:321 start_codon:yes stop_codon:yes gene_type:complete